MGRDNEILRLMQYLQNEGINVTNEFVKDIKQLVKTDVVLFAKQIFKDFSRKDFKKYNKFEKLKLTDIQKRKITGYSLWRYEYRNTSNLRCIFILENADNSDEITLICAFNEDGDKRNGSNSYNKNIQRAISIASNIIE